LRRLELIGALKPNVVLYINNQPNWDLKQSFNAAQLIADNGNHWRKILTIFAKLCAVDDWRTHRDLTLLQTQEQINFGDEIEANATIHIFAGKSCWQRFAVSEKMLGEMQRTACSKVFYYRSAEYGLMLYTAYFDYRQFPNSLIDEVRLLIKSC